MGNGGLNLTGKFPRSSHGCHFDSQKERELCETGFVFSPLIASEAIETDSKALIVAWALEARSSAWYTKDMIYG